MLRHAAVAVLLALVPLHAPQAQGRQLDLGDAIVHYEVTGTGDAVVFIHGWAQDLRIWDAQVPVLADRFRVVRYDRRGFGRSTGHADPSADPDDLRILLDSLGIARASVVGLSAGAAAALRFAAAFPDRVDRLVLYGLGGAGLEGFPAVPEAMRLPDLGAIARQVGVDSLRRLIEASPLAWRPPGQPGLGDNPPAWWTEYTGRDLLDPRPPSGRVPPVRWERIGEIRLPTLLVHGDHDLPIALLIADSLERRLPDVRRVIIRDGGHGAHFQQPAQFHRALLEFLGERRRQEGETWTRSGV